MSFKKNKYIVVKKVLSKELVNFIYQYFLNKKKVANILFESKYISPFTEYFGTWDDKTVPNTYSHYSDIVMETLLEKLKLDMEKHTNLKLSEACSYARIYKKGDILKRHKDRFSCEISTTLNLGGDPWFIYLEPSGKKNMKGIKIDLKPGDMLIYSGCDSEHWRDEFKGETCAQVFLHYNNTTTKGSKINKFDQRPTLGLPSWFKNKKITVKNKND
jgi:hypothetical protein|tara:strand:+ start:2685 stop:3332 length:648 start_codon:yes stop_codon:yes gene_type:complete